MIRKTVVKQIVEAVEEIVSGRCSARIKVSKSSELHQLAQAVNKLAEHYQMAQEAVKTLNQQLKKSNFDTIMALIEALNAKDPYTRGHSERVPIYSLLLSEQLNLTSEEIDSIYLASFLHDIGKIGIHEDVLNKPAELTDDEYEMVKNHAHISSQIVAHVPNMSHIASIVRHHHERHNGEGYPDGLKGDEIPLGSRILAIADAFDAMTTCRPYRAAFKPADALLEIQKCAGTQFDPELANTFVSAYSKNYGNRIPNVNAC